MRQEVTNLAVCRAWQITKVDGARRGQMEGEGGVHKSSDVGGSLGLYKEPGVRICSFSSLSRR